MKKYLVVGGCILMVLLSGCMKKTVTVEETSAVIEETTSRPVETTQAETEPPTTEPPTTEAIDENILETDPREEIDGKIRSYLTGQMVEASIGNTRPLAAMISNDKQAMPHYGMSRAEIIYEAPVEGAMVRYLAIMEDFQDVERIGSMRSCRNYYIDIAAEYDPIFAHYGQSKFAEPYLYLVDGINGVSGSGTNSYYRTSDRKMPHNAYTSYEKIEEAKIKFGYDSAYDENQEGHFQFTKDGKVELLNREDSFTATNVKPGYVGNDPWFEYREEDGRYYRYQYGAEHVTDEGQLVTDNIIIQYCYAGYYQSTDYRNIDVTNPSNLVGYYITKGKAIPVQWKKNENGQTKYYDANGAEIVLNQGKTWICIMTDQEVGKIKFE